MVSMIAASVAGSSADVGSSSSKIGAFFKNARAMPIRWRWPTPQVPASFAYGLVPSASAEQIVPPRPARGLDNFFFCRIGRLHAMFSRIAVEKSNVSCKTIAICARKLFL